MTSRPLSQLAAVPGLTRMDFAIGIDPGPTTGICVLNLDTARPGDAAEIYQCNARAASWLLCRICDRITGNTARAGMEPFIRSRGPGTAMRPGQVTADQVAELNEYLTAYGVPCSAQRAGLVKPWATDKRLDAAGLLALTPGSTHARDAARHALYCAVWNCGYPDPLSRRARS